MESLHSARQETFPLAAVNFPALLTTDGPSGGHPNRPIHDCR
jgi:hypothetical protein